MLLAREFGWTIAEMRELTPRELGLILQELQRQSILEQYNEQRNHWAFLAAVITNGFGMIAGMFGKRKPKRVEPDDFLSKDARKKLQQLLKQRGRKMNWDKHIQEAKQKGLHVPKS